jgi:hypothetical protein
MLLNMELFLNLSGKQLSNLTYLEPILDYLLQFASAEHPELIIKFPNPLNCVMGKPFRKGAN